MRIRDTQYIPVLKWRVAEYQALYRLEDEQKQLIVPLIVIPPVEFDFETWIPHKSLQEHVDSFVDRYGKKWGDRSAFVDLHPALFDETLSTGENAMTYIFRRLGETEHHAIPVIGQVGRAIAPAVKIAKSDRRGLGVRLSPEQILDGTLATLKAQLLADLDLSQIDLIIDLQKPANFEPIDGFATALSMHIGEIDDLLEYRSFIVVGASIRLPEVEAPGGRLRRHEWYLYTELLKPEYDLKRRPTYGDYTIEIPEFAPGLDFRKISPAARIVYTIPHEWLVVKGRAYKNDTRQMRSLGEQIIKSRYYSGPDFSFGDRRIKEVVDGISKPGNPVMMKQVGISHHFSYVLHDLASSLGQQSTV